MYFEIQRILQGCMISALVRRKKWPKCHANEGTKSTNKDVMYRGNLHRKSMEDALNDKTGNTIIDILLAPPLEGPIWQIASGRSSDL